MTIARCARVVAAVAALCAPTPVHAGMVVLREVTAIHHGGSVLTQRRVIDAATPTVLPRVGEHLSTHGHS